MEGTFKVFMWYLKNRLIIPKTILYYKYGITGCDQYADLLHQRFKNDHIVVIFGFYFLIQSELKDIVKKITL